MRWLQMIGRKWMIVAGAAVLLIGGGFYWHSRATKGALVVESDTTKATVTRADITQSVASTGTVISNLDVQIKCRASGQITKFPFDISDHVKIGDLLLQLDPLDEQRQVDIAQAQADVSQAKYEEAKTAEQQAELDLQTATETAQTNLISMQVKDDNLRRKADRQKELLAQKLASQEDYETAETDSAAADADLSAAHIAQEELKSQATALQMKKEDVVLAAAQLKGDQVSLDNARQQLSYCTVNSPMDGVVSDVEVELGTIISSAISNIGGGTTVMTISDLSKIFINGSVDESDIGDVRVGQDVDITADAFPGKKFSGKVVRIATQGVNTSNVVTFTVKIEVTSKNKDLLKPQMTANVEIIEASKKGVLTVPTNAVFRKDRKTQVTVVQDDGTNKDVEVQAGINDGDNQEIISGLTEGQTVIVHRSDTSSKWSAQSRPLGIPGGAKKS